MLSERQVEARPRPVAGQVLGLDGELAGILDLGGGVDGVDVVEVGRGERAGGQAGGQVGGHGIQDWTDGRPLTAPGYRW